MRGLLMKPESKSQTLLSVTRSKAKMFEYDIPEADHIKIPKDPAELFTLTIGLLGDLAKQINTDSPNLQYTEQLRDYLKFSAQFFDAYLQSRLNRELDPMMILLGSASYYLCGLPGSSRILASQIRTNNLELNCRGLENLLLWLLTWNPTTIHDISENLYSDLVINISTSLSQFYLNGDGKLSLFERTARLRRLAYDSGNPKELLFADVSCAVVKRRFENSAWNSIPKYSKIPVEHWAETLKKERFMRELWPAQHLLGEKGLYSGRSAVVQMPTSAGKTRATEIIIRSAFLSERASLAVIIAPFRALCHEIKDSLSTAFSGELVQVDELTDVSQNDFDIQQLLGQKQVLIVTPEKLVFVLRHNPEIAEHIGLLVYDEGHQFDNGARGITYELLLTSLKSMVPKTIQTVLISAVISNADKIGTWINGDDFEQAYGTSLVPTYRTVAFASWTETRGLLQFVNTENPESIEFFVPRVIESQTLKSYPRERSERIFPNKKDGNSVALFLGLKLVQHGSVAVFCGTKTSAESLCKKLVEAYERDLSAVKPIEYSNYPETAKLAHLYECNLGNGTAATKCAKLGVFTHHGNTPQGIRLAVEYAMKHRQARFVICTSTLAQGINLPIRYLIVTSVQQGHDPIKVRDFHNLIGRAGRADEHTEGSVLFADHELFDEHGWQWKQIKKLLQPGNSEPCTSSLLSIFESLKSENGQIEIEIDALDVVSSYINNTLGKLIDDTFSQHQEGFTREGIANQINWKVNIISAIENYLMSHTHETEQVLEDLEITNLTIGTLAYFLAPIVHKNELVQIFVELSRNIERNVKDSVKRRAYGRTMYGVRTASEIEQWVENNLNKLLLLNDIDELFILIWPIISLNVSNKTFRKCDPPTALQAIAMDWTHGETFAGLFESVLKSKITIIAGTQRRRPTPELVVDLCENGLSYDGALVVAAITEFVGLLKPNGTENITRMLSELQKRLKYGLPSPNCFTIYELGFADRAVVMDLCAIFGNAPLDRRGMVKAIKNNMQRVRTILDKYPSYFVERLNELAR